MRHSPLSQFETLPIFRLHLGPLDLSFTNASLAMVFAAILCMSYCILALYRPKIVPSRMQSSLELMHSMVFNMARSTLDERTGKKFFPLIFSIFLFTLACNLIGAFPKCFAATGQIIVTFALASLVFISMLTVGFFKHGVRFFKILLPTGCPIWLAPIIIVVELFSFLSKPISLSLRLAANVVSGHVLLHVLATTTLALFLILKPLPFAFIVLLTGAEICIAILQAYIFTVLSCVYLGEVINLH